jgi:hypothetical protein
MNNLSKKYNMTKIVILFICALGISYAETIQANVTAVKAKGNDGAYRFAVTLQSTETGCTQYADWWEVLSKEGTLLYRRILVHSHPDTQPFTRSGGSVDISKDDIVYVRGHMNKEGYVGDVMMGSVFSGFKKVSELPNFATTLEMQAPLPKGCLY